MDRNPSVHTLLIIQILKGRVKQRHFSKSSKKKKTSTIGVREQGRGKYALICMIHQNNTLARNLLKL